MRRLLIEVDRVVALFVGPNLDDRLSATLAIIPHRRFQGRAGHRGIPAGVRFHLTSTAGFEVASDAGEIARLLAGGGE